MGKNKNLIGISSACFYPSVKTEDSFKVIHDMDYKNAEIFLNSPSEYEKDFALKLKEQSDKYQISVLSVHSFSSSFEPYLFDKYKRRRDDMKKFFTSVCRVGKILGARCYTFHGMKLLKYDFIDLKFIADIYKEIVYIAGENGIKLAQENVSWCMSSDLRYLEYLKENVKGLYFTLDVKQSYKAGISPEKYVNIMKDRLTNFHINDRSETDICLLPGKGDVNLKGLIHKMNNYNYAGPAILEVYRENYKSYDELASCKEYIQKLFEEY